MNYLAMLKIFYFKFNFLQDLNSLVKTIGSRTLAKLLLGFWRKEGQVSEIPVLFFMAIVARVNDLQSECMNWDGLLNHLSFLIPSVAFHIKGWIAQDLIQALKDTGKTWQETREQFQRQPSHHFRLWLYDCLVEAFAPHERKYRLKLNRILNIILDFLKSPSSESLVPPRRPDDANSLSLEGFADMESDSSRPMSEYIRVRIRA